MSTKHLGPYSQPPAVRSHLLKNVPEMASIPSMEDLEALQAELKAHKDSAVARSKKASQDLRFITESMRRLKEKEKGKQKVKRERDYTPDPAAKPRHLPGSAARSAVPSARSSLDPRKPDDRASVDPRRDDKKKKRKYAEVDPDSDGGHSAQRIRKGSPSPLYSQKALKPVPSLPSKAIFGQDFTAPPSPKLLQKRPPYPTPPIPGPSKPSEVTEDFSKLKIPAQQVLVQTFYTSVEPYLRPIREEDIGFLEYCGDEVEPFVMPKLGVHYSQLWEEADAAASHTPAFVPLPGLGLAGKSTPAPASAFTAPKATWDPSTLGDGDLTAEEKGHGPLTERVISALLPITDPGGWKGVKAAEDAMEGRPGGSGAAAARRERLHVTDLESRIRDTMRWHGLLDATPIDYSEKTDDPIASALRDAQAQLRVVSLTNKLRKARLVEIGLDRLAYQEYLEVRDMIDRNITSLYARLQKKEGPKVAKKKKKPLAGAAAASAAQAAAREAKREREQAREREALGLPPLPPKPASFDRDGSTAPNGEEGTPGPNGVLPPVQCPAALGMIPDDDNHLMVNDQLKALVETRKKWVEQVGSVFTQKQLAQPGRIWGFPKESVYKGIEEEVRVALGQAGSAPLAELPTLNILSNGNGHHADPETGSSGSGSANGMAVDGARVNGTGDGSKLNGWDPLKEKGKKKALVDGDTMDLS